MSAFDPLRTLASRSTATCAQFVIFKPDSAFPSSHSSIPRRATAIPFGSHILRNDWLSTKSVENESPNENCQYQRQGASTIRGKLHIEEATHSERYRANHEQHQKAQSIAVNVDSGCFRLNGRERSYNR
jgi:hypothetical protein